MIPGPWVALVLVLAGYRLFRLLGWDDFPPLVRARNWVTGCYTVTSGSFNQHQGLTSEPSNLEVRYRRPAVAQLLGCPYCLGFWIAIGWYLAWLFAPAAALYAAGPFALSAGIGLVGRWLDP